MSGGAQSPVDEVLSLAEAAERMLVEKLSVPLIPCGKT